MPSPFPGMNPYLEQPGVWSDFHSGFIGRLQEQLADQLLPRYLVLAEEQVFLHELDQPKARLVKRPDISIVTPTTDLGLGPSTTATIEAPSTIELEEFHDEQTETHLEIIDRIHRRVVTVIEVLSPTNKTPGPDRNQYLHKRRTFTHGGVNFVEIDLLRGGARAIEPLSPCDYLISVVRAPTWNRIGTWPLSLRDPLPTIPVPLKPGENDATLNLKLALDQRYDRIGYAHFIYNLEPEPPLSPEDAAWAMSLILRPIA